MLTIKEAEEILKKEYHIDNFTYLMRDVLLPDYFEDKHEISYNNQVFASVTMLGVSSSCEVTVFEVHLNDGTQNRRVAITQEMFRILRGLRINNAIVSFVNADKRNYRISLLTSKYEFDGEKVVKILSNPRRLSYSLGFGTKTKTAYKFLIEKGKVNSFDELVARFSVEVVNKQFYSEIATAFTELVGGERNGKKYEKLLNMHSVVDYNKYAEFSVRLIGRIMFCWFLREKRSEKGISLLPDDMLTINTVESSVNYYHHILEPLFFELLNTDQRWRKHEFQTDYYNQVPFLNGGLFSPHTDDRYKYDPVNHCGIFGVVTIPNEWFIRLYTILNEYNFTVDENTAYDIELSIDPEMLGRIFENLLAEINPETGENAKKSTGSFYTPRDIVDYMVDSSLLEYLKTKTEINENKLRALISYFKEDDEDVQFSKQEKKAIIDSLYTITTLDPACGSGAFPIGMLQKIVYILQELDPEATLWFDKATENVSIFIKKEFEKKFNSGSLNYIRKLSVIQNSIFGIDIQPIAVEISRLRCFLSLIIEERVFDDEENRGINPLPNLDFKFIVANSLIKLPDESNSDFPNMYMFENQDYIDELKAVREEYFNAELGRKTQLIIEFGNIQKRIFQDIIDRLKGGSSDRYRALVDWSPFENKITDWFEPDWMFGIKDGFDIVIGNPPYIQLQKSVSSETSQKLGDIYKDQKYQTFTKTGDIYCLFYERGNQLLRHGGILCYITSNKWMRAGYGERLRGYLANNTNPKMLIDFSGKKVFENATVDVNIILFEKARNKLKTKTCIIKDDCLNNLSVYVEQHGLTSDFSTSESWLILLPLENSIRAKMRTQGVPLKEWNLRINRGILTGFNEAFIISTEKKNELISADPKSAEIIRPILRGRDIKRYAFSFTNLWLIATFPSRHYDIEDYPAVKKHLSSFGVEKLEQTGNKHYVDGVEIRARKKTGNKWYETQDSISYWNDFSMQKIVWGNLCLSAQFALADEDYYISAPSPMIVPGNKYVLAVLNSRLGDWYIRQLGVTRNGGYFEYKPMFVEQLPVPILSENEQAIFITLVDKIHVSKEKSEDTLALEEEINKLVYQLYDLNKEEIAYIEKAE
ncbi:MAG: Eco57I restriction-modification methylase domain-containing protein [Clostridiales bacterium]|nr:Eco57I restriction-modification methylase domain-containing protein [Clostridiales bacterium]